MKILMPFWNFAFFETRFLAIKSISERVQKILVIYVEGEPKKLWEKYATFHKIDVPGTRIRSKIIRFFIYRKKIYNQIKNLDVNFIFSASGLWRQEFSRYYTMQKQVPYVVYVRGSHREVRKTKNTNKVSMKIANYLDTRSLKAANRIIPISEKVMKNLEKMGIDQEKIAHPVPVGVDTHMFRPIEVEKSKEFTVAYAGRISPEKRVKQLLKIAGRMKDVHFIIAGKKQMPVSFPNNVDYFGPLSHSEMPEFFNKADLVVLPSVSEGLGGVILEAYACGKPVLVAEDAAQKELKIFGSVSPLENFEKEILKLKNSDLKSISKGARTFVKNHFTWDKFGDSMVENFKKVIG